MNCKCPVLGPLILVCLRLSTPVGHSPEKPPCKDNKMPYPETYRPADYAAYAARKFLAEIASSAIARGREGRSVVSVSLIVDDSASKYAGATGISFADMRALASMSMSDLQSY